MLKGLILAALTTLAACAAKPADEEQFPSEVTPPPAGFQQGVRALDKEQFAEAARIFDRLLVAKPATEQDLVTTYNSGAAYEGLGNCARASERYREVTRGSAGKFSNLESAAFFRLALMYECLGQDVKAITALLDAKKRRGLPPVTQNTEVPARLAAAYARIGNNKKALEYFAVANKGLKKIVSEETGKKQHDILGQSLYLMGQLNPSQKRAEGDPKAFLLGLSMQQPHLLQAIELRHPVWSKKAAADLSLAYDNIWKYKPEDANDYFVRAIQVARELKRIRMPNETPEADEIFRKVDATESRLNIEIAKISESTKLTPEAEKREGIKRQGRLVNPVAPPPKKTVRKR